MYADALAARLGKIAFAACMQQVRRRRRVGCLSRGEEGAAGPGVLSQSAAQFYMHMAAPCIRTGPGQSASEHGVW